MRLDSVSVENFRCYQRAGCEFSPGVNVICGSNAQGKTTLLEAAYLMTGAKSFRTRFDRDMIRFGADGASIKASLEVSGRALDCDIAIGRGVKKRITVNGVKKSPSELAGRFRVILFSPEDLELVRGGAAERRRFMDAAICQLRPGYAVALGEANRLLEHKTRILRDWRQEPSLLEVLEDFSLRYAAACARLIHYRSAWSERLAAVAPGIHADVSGRSERLEVAYRTISGLDPKGKKPSELYPALVEHWRSHRDAELKAGSCLSGAHKDELGLSIDGAEARGFASQGQARTAALSLKLAEREISMADAGEPPVLLLDDVLSELDARRQDFVLNSIRGGQVLITCCEDEGISSRTGGNVLRVEDGAIV